MEKTVTALVAELAVVNRQHAEAWDHATPAEFHALNKRLEQLLERLRTLDMAEYVRVRTAMRDGTDVVVEECEHEEACGCPCATCDDKQVVGTYGPNNTPLCGDCRDIGGFCSCGDMADECGCEEDEEEVPVFPGEVNPWRHGQQETDVDGRVWTFNLPEDKWE
jgi:hypothetical protein